MARTNTPSFVVTRRLYPDMYQEKHLEALFDLVTSFYNDILEEANRRKDRLLLDVWYCHARKEYGRCKEQEKAMLARIETFRGDRAELRSFTNKLKHIQKELRSWGKELSGCQESYGFTEYSLHAYTGELKNNKYKNRIGINIAQKVGTAVWKAHEKVMFGEGKKVHFRKKGQTRSFEDKSPNTGIVYHSAGSNKKHLFEHVLIMGMPIRLKPVRKGDTWLQAAMMSSVKFCRIVREPYGAHYRYFVQIVMKGEAPVKHPIGGESAGLDPGVSTMTYDSDTHADMIFLSKDIARYQKEIKTAARVYERRRRMANPQNFNENGTIRKDTDDFRKVWDHTKGMQEAAMRLKTAYRKMSEYVKQSNGYDTNVILKKVSMLWVEDMDYKALAKRAKQCKRQEKTSVVKSKTGKKMLVHKYKRRKRYGASILKHAPARFISKLKRKIFRQGGSVLTINTRVFRASQYDHEANAYIKHELSERTKLIGGHRVQRDIYSAFLMHHSADDEHPDREACKRDFKAFLKRQGETIARALRSGDPTGNFGLNDFLNTKNGLASQTV